jgi:hypothetical protein
MVPAKADSSSNNRYYSKQAQWQNSKLVNWN